MSTNEIQNRVHKIVAEQLGITDSAVSNEKSFMTDLGADSLDTVELVMALEDEFDILIDDETAETIKSVQNAIDVVASLRKDLEMVELTPPAGVEA